MYISKRYRIEEQDQILTLEIIRQIGFESALDEAYNKALYLVSNNPSSMLATKWLAWSHNLIKDSREAGSNQIANDLASLASFYRRLAHKTYWFQRSIGQISELAEFIRPAEDHGSCNINI
jgi:hypothetical protein